MSGHSGSNGERRLPAVSPHQSPAGRPDRPDAAARHVLGALEGAALDLSEGPDDVRIALVDREGRTAMVLGPFDEEDAVARWRSLALASGLVPMLKVSTGAVEALAAQIGRLRVGPARQRRPRMLRRRPRFLVRRKTSRLPALPLVHREKEMAAGTRA